MSDLSDLIERLRGLKFLGDPFPAVFWDLTQEAADALEAANKRIAELETHVAACSDTCGFQARRIKELEAENERLQRRLGDHITNLLNIIFDNKVITDDIEDSLIRIADYEKDGNKWPPEELKADIRHLVTGSTDLTPSMAVADAANFDFSDVIIIGYQDGELVLRSSAMTRAEAVYMLLAAIDHSRGIE